MKKTSKSQLLWVLAKGAKTYKPELYQWIKSTKQFQKLLRKVYGISEKEHLAAEILFGDK